ncbi:MAG: hypothetical protein ACRDIY_07745, partial [Chloroflexota bacterium]
MAPGRSKRRQLSPLLKELRLGERRSRRGVVPTDDQLADWEARLAQAGGSGEAVELAARPASIRHATALAREPAGAMVAQDPAL